MQGNIEGDGEEEKGLFEMIKTAKNFCPYLSGSGKASMPALPSHPGISTPYTTQSYKYLVNKSFFKTGFVTHSLNGEFSYESSVSLMKLNFRGRIFHITRIESVHLVEFFILSFDIYLIRK